MDGYQSDELLDGSPLLQISSSSSESGDSATEADSYRDKHIEFMTIAFRAKQPQQLDSARTKPTVPNPLQCFGPLLGHIACVKRTPQQPFLYQVDGLLDQLDGLLNQLDPLTTEAKR